MKNIQKPTFGTAKEHGVKIKIFTTLSMVVYEEERTSMQEAKENETQIFLYLYMQALKSNR